MAFAFLLVAAGCGGGASTPAPIQQSGQGNSGQPVQPASAEVLTFHNDNARTGVNAAETVLTPATVNVVSFGKVATIAVEGDIYAQPLYVPNVTINQAAHNLVIVATEHDQVYAIDANSQTVVWHRDFLNPPGTVTTVSSNDNGCPDLAPEVGITGTPVIDGTNMVVDVLVRTKETTTGQAQFYQRLHSLNLTNGEDRVQARVVVTPPDRYGQLGTAQFDPLIDNQRSALLLVAGNIYVTWASHCDLGGYRGWLMTFDQDTLQPSGAWTPDPTGLAGGIWMSGGGPSSDSKGNVYLAVGNGTADAMLGGSNYGDSVVRLQWEGQKIYAADYFTPYDYQTLLSEDLDLGTGSAVLLPSQNGASHPDLLVVGSKDGTIYLLDRDNLGHSNPDNDNQVVENFENNTGHAFSTPVFWNNTLYFAWPWDSVRALQYDPISQQIDTTSSSDSGSIVIGYPGASPAISANGTSNGILWMIQSDQYPTGGNAVVRAFDATNLSTELYDSELSHDRDHAGGAIKFTVPTIAAGHVFVGAHNELDIYGLLSQ